VLIQLAEALRLHLVLLEQNLQVVGTLLQDHVGVLKIKDFQYIVIQAAIHGFLCLSVQQIKHGQYVLNDVFVNPVCGWHRQLHHHLPTTFRLEQEPDH